MAKKRAETAGASKKASSPKAKKPALKDPKGGLTAAGRAAFKEKEGANLKPGVTKALKDMTPEEMKRKGSFLRRHYANLRGPLVDDDGKPTRLALQAHAWGEPVPKTPEAAAKLAEKGSNLLERYKKAQEKDKDKEGSAKPARPGKPAKAAKDGSAKSAAPKGRKPSARAPRSKPKAKAKPSGSSDASDGPYTDPGLRDRLKAEIMDGDKGGKPGQWSARKSQLLASEYKKAGGGYTKGRRKKTEAQSHLDRWTDEAWTTSDGEPAIRDGETARYLPEKAWNDLTPAEKEATDREKKAGSKEGKQFVANTRAAKKARKSASS